MGPTPTHGQLSEALRSKEGKLPDIFRILADVKEMQDSAQIWINSAKVALINGEVERCKSILETYRERNPHDIVATLLLSTACQRLGSEDALDESVMLARSAVHSARSTEDALRAAVQVAVSLGSRARMHTRQQVDRQRDREEAIQVLSGLTNLAPGSTRAQPAASTAHGSDAVAHGLYTLALLQAEQGGSHPATATALEARHAAQAAGDPQLVTLSLVLAAAILSTRCAPKVVLAYLAQPNANAEGAPNGASARAAEQQRSPPPGWGDVLVCRLRARLLGALSDVAGAMEALAQAKRLLGGWLEGERSGGAGAGLPEGVSRVMVEEALSKVWGELAVAMAKSGQKAEALAAADQALALRPWAAASRHALGAVHEALGQYDEAGAAYDDAMALDPTHAPTLLRKAALHIRHGTGPDLAVARDLLAEALTYDPRSTAGWHELGCVAAALEHRPQAEEHMLMAVRLASEAPALELGELPLAPPAAGV